MPSLVFDDQSLDVDDVKILSVAYEEACDELIEHHNFTASQLSAILEIMKEALLVLYHAGQTAETMLARYATSKALSARHNVPSL